VQFARFDAGPAFGQTRGVRREFKRACIMRTSVAHDPSAPYDGTPPHRNGEEKAGARDTRGPRDLQRIESIGFQLTADYRTRSDVLRLAWVSIMMSISGACWAAPKVSRSPLEP
jgi:hypothetical protein